MRIVSWWLESLSYLRLPQYHLSRIWSASGEWSLGCSNEMSNTDTCSVVESAGHHVPSKRCRAIMIGLGILPASLKSANSLPKNWLPDEVDSAVMTPYRLAANVDGLIVWSYMVTLVASTTFTVSCICHSMVNCFACTWLFLLCLVSILNSVLSSSVNASRTDEVMGNSARIAMNARLAGWSRWESF